ncbi:MAG: transglutaminase-like domain-containing protein [Candidatus Nanoarchaeia archaeon]|nr:transglutaminase-like domain-containing protein [Candidatus Nanoarchaeia archaeon]
MKLENNKLNEELTEEDKGRSPIVYILALFMILLLILWIVPHYKIKIDPEPKNIPSKEDILPEKIDFVERNSTIFARSQFIELIDPNDPLIKQTASKVASQSCDSGKVCQAKAIFYFVRDNFNYVSDPETEYIESAREVLATGGADCDGIAVLLANLQEAIGVETRFVFIPGHVYVQIKLEDALKKYKTQDDWINLDPTCSYCEFGEIPYQNIESRKTYV